MLTRSIIGVVAVLGIGLGAAAYWAHLHHHAAPEPGPVNSCSEEETSSCCPLSRGTCTGAVALPAPTGEDNCCETPAAECPAKAPAKATAADDKAPAPDDAKGGSEP
jgi:hypothetical protein